MRPLLAAGAIAGTLLVSGLLRDARAASVTDLRPLTLPNQVNHVFHFSPDGATATVSRRPAADGTLRWRVVLPDASGREQAVTVVDPRSGAAGNGLTADPSGRRSVVRFAYGRIDGGKQDMLVLSATLHGDGGAGAADFTVYRLDGDTFRPALTAQSSARFCTATAALHDEFALAWQPGDKPRTPDGCQPGADKVAAAPATPAPPAPSAVPPSAPHPAAPAAQAALQPPPKPPTEPPTKSASQPQTQPQTQPLSQPPAGTIEVPAPAAKPASAAGDCSDVARQQHLDLCEAIVFGLLHNQPVQQAKTEEWSLRAQEHPQCRDAAATAAAQEAGQRVWQRIGQAPASSDDEKLQLIVAGCLPPPS